MTEGFTETGEVEVLSVVGAGVEMVFGVDTTGGVETAGFEVLGAGEETVGFDNYIDALKSAEFWSATKTTFLFTAISVTLELIIGLGMALVVYQCILAVNLLCVVLSSEGVSNYSFHLTIYSSFKYSTFQ